MPYLVALLQRYIVDITFCPLGDRSQGEFEAQKLIISKLAQYEFTVKISLQPSTTQSNPVHRTINK